jgi:pyruvate dehydrogenase E1 component beta subunit
VVCPANPADAKGLLLASIRDPDPVLFFEPKRIYRAAKGEVPEGDYTVPLGKAKVVRPGAARHGDRVGRDALRGARGGEPGRGEQGVDCEVIDPAHAVAARHRHHRRVVKKTGRVVVVHEAPKSCGLGAEIVSLINEKAFLHLEAPPAA